MPKVTNESATRAVLVLLKEQQTSGLTALSLQAAGHLLWGVASLSSNV